MTKASFFALTATVVAGAGLLVPAGPAASEAGTMTADFNGDAVADMVVGVPFEDVGAVADAGAVNVVYGSADGLAAAGNQLWHQNSPGITDTAEAGDRFGSAIAIADFDSDGFDDLAVGVPFEDVGAVADAGAVNVLYGSAGGLTAAGNQLWHQNSPGIADTAEASDRFGESLAAADFGGSGQADLAIGVTDEDVGTIVNAGAVNVVYGSAGGGLAATGNQFWHQSSPGIAGTAEAGDLFGRSLAAANFGGSGQADLAIGVLLEDVGTVVDAGSVNVLYGSTSGLAATGNQLWHQDSPGIADTAESFDDFGLSIAAANFGGSGQADLAIGVPHEDVGTIVDAGSVNVLYGSTSGLAATGNQLWHQNSAGIIDIAADGDLFGDSLAAANLGGSGQADLAIGVPSENVGTSVNAGAVNVLYGAAGGLAGTGNQFWHQDSPGIADTAEGSDQFGESLAAANFGSSGQADLAIGVPAEDLGTAVNAGAVNVLYGAVGGLAATGNQFWHQNNPGIADVAEPDDRFGSSVAAS